MLLIIDAYKGISHPYSSSERSPSGAGVAYRITKIGLDADRGLLDRNINRLVRLAAKGEDGEPIHVITLSFAELKPVLSAKIGDIKQELSKLRKTRAAAVARRLQREIDIVLRRKTASLRGAEGSFELYDDVRAVATSLNISAGEQQILFKAGAAAVQHRLDVINKYIVSNMQAGGR